MIVDVKKIVDERKVFLKDKVKELKENGINPKLSVIIANTEDSSRSYVKNKKKVCEEIGILYEDYFFEENIQTEDLVNFITKLNDDKNQTAILVQLPLYKHLNEKEILNSISSKKDVDGFSVNNMGNLFLENNCIIPCTPKGIITILESIGETFIGKHAVVVGRSNIVGRPLAQLLLNKNCTVTVCHSKTKDLSKYTKEADILVVAVGKSNTITKDMVKKGSTVIDVGINNVNGKIVGDVDTEEVEKVVKYITKVPGGVGLTTVLSLVENIIELIEN